MDIFAHALWTAVGARGANVPLQKKGKRKFNILWTAFWGIFPDLFAFGIPIVLTIPSLLRNGYHFDRAALLGLPQTLYQYSHSLVIWAAVFLIMWAIKKRPALPLFGWALHILIDIPSHAANFFPTPFLFPLSNYRFTHGVAWSNKWYMLINYSALLIVFLIMFIRDYRKLRKQKQAADYVASK